MDALTMVFDENGISQMFTSINERGEPYDYYVQRIPANTYFRSTPKDVPVSYRYVFLNAKGEMTTGGMLQEAAQLVVNARQARAVDHRSTDYPLGFLGVNPNEIER